MRACRAFLVAASAFWAATPTQAAVPSEVLHGLRSATAFPLPGLTSGPNLLKLPLHEFRHLVFVNTRSAAYGAGEAVWSIELGVGLLLVCYFTRREKDQQPKGAWLEPCDHRVVGP